MSRKSIPIRGLNAYWVIKYGQDGGSDARQKTFDLGERFLWTCCSKLQLIAWRKRKTSQTVDLVLKV